MRNSTQHDAHVLAWAALKVDVILLWAARYVLRDMHHQHPDCGYGKMAAACERAADRAERE